MERTDTSTTLPKPTRKGFGARRGFVRDQDGAVAIEFGILAIPFFALVGAILETSLVFLASQVLDSAVDDASRLIRTGQAQQQNFEIDDFRAAVCERTFGMFDCDAIHFRVRPVTNFETASPDPVLAEDCEAPCDFIATEDFDPGGASSIVIIQASYKWPIILDFGGFALANVGDNTRLMSSVRVLRNEPF